VVGRKLVVQLCQDAPQAWPGVDERHLVAGLGQCSNACPNDVPVMELFRTIAASTQEAFEYEAGRNPNEPPPLSVFREREFPEVTGGLD